MIGIALTVGFVAVGAALLLNLYRLLRGPDLVDRVLALDTIVINAIGLIVLVSMGWATALPFEAALLIATVGFVSTVAFCKFLLRGDVIE